MKKKKKIGNSAQSTVIPVGHKLVAQVMSAPPLKDVAKEFLKNNKRPEHKIYKIVFEDLVQVYGKRPVDRLNPAQIRRFVSDPHLSPLAQNQRLTAIKALLDWSHDRHYLAPNEPTAASSLKVSIPILPPPVLTPAAFKRLLEGTRVVELLLWMVLTAFAGLRWPELEKLTWTSIKPGVRIGILPGAVGNEGRTIQMQPALDAWLRPFYGSSGKVFKSSGQRIRHRFRIHARTLGVVLGHRTLRASYIDYRLVQTFDPFLVAGELGYRSFHTLQPSCLRVTRQEATDYFAFTPEAVGIRNWPALVAKFLGSPQDE